MRNKSGFLKLFSMTLVAGASLQVQARDLSYSSLPADAQRPGHVKLVISPEVTGSGNKVDLLFVVDNSGSMESKQAQLATSVPALAAKLSGFADLNAAVTSSSYSIGFPADQSQAGEFVGVHKVLNSASPTFASDLASRIKLGTTGQSYEQFFEPTILALSEPLSSNSNAGFLRKDAALSIIFLSDADDQSSTTPDQFIDFLDRIKGRGNYTLTGFLVPSDDNTCDRGGEYPPVKFETTINKVGGKIVNLCSDFSAAIDGITGDIKRSLQRTIQLPYKPLLASVQVSYGSTVFSAGDTHNGWTYDSTTNSIVLGDLIDFSTLPQADLVIEFDQI